MPGYKVTTVEPLEAGMVCPHCGLMLRDAVQTEAGVRLCESCYKDKEKCKDPKSASGMTVRVDPEQTLVYHDRAIRRAIYEIIVHCIFYLLGCPWQGQLKHLQEHCQGCHYRPQCKYCLAELVTEIEEHHATCPKYPVKCDKCEREIHREKVSEHKGHLGSCFTQERISGGGKLVTGVSDDYPESEASLATHSVEEKVRRAKNASDKAFKESCFLQEEFEDIEQQQDISMLEYRETDISESKLETKVDYFIKKSTDHDKQIAVLDKQIAVLNKQTAVMMRQISELKIQLEAFFARTHNGKFVWRIPDVSRRRRDAIEERITSIFSPPFYTGRPGYKMCIRAYLNGDGIGYNTHFSFFFVIMKGEYDPLLNWPFKGKVTFTLVDQGRRSKHIYQTFKTTPESTSFQQPCSEMNIAVGRPKFCEQSVLENGDYVHNNVMYIQCSVCTAARISEGTATE